MEALGIHLSPFFNWLLKTTIQASVLICLILFVKLILRQKLPVRWHYYLWLLLLIRLALPWSPQSRISIFNLMPQSSSKQEVQAVTIINESSDGTVQSDRGTPDTGQSGPSPGQTADVETVKSEPQQASEPVSDPVTTGTNKTPPVVIQPAQSQTIDLKDILPLIWLAGALILAVYILLRNIILWRAIKSERQVTDQDILELLEDCKMQMRIQTVVGVVVTDKVKSPALFGFVRPRLLLPQGLLEELDLDELQYVFLHELAHLRRNDIYFGWVVSLLQVVHWFNPLIWFAFRRMRTDQELACDALALSTMSVEEPPKYGRTLVNLFERFSQVNYVPSIAGILEDKSQLERRIKMITKYKKSSYRRSPLAAILIIILGCITLPDAISTKASQILAAESAPPIVLRRVWADSDVDVEGEISPDGRYISYVDWDTGDLAVYEIATGKKHRLTNKGSWDESDEYAEYSTWSPDGKKIVYDWSNKEYFIELRIVGLDGSEPRILYRNKEVGWAQTYDWSPDGKQILACFSTKGLDQIVLVSVADGSVRVLKTLNKGYPQNMVFSPDGRYIVYDFPQKENSPESDIFLMLADGSRKIPLVEHPADDCVLDWTPDGKNILFTSDRTGSPCMWSIAITDGIVQGIPKLVKPDIGRKFISMGFTKDGSFYYGRGGRGMSNIYTAKLDPKTGKVLVPPKKTIQRFEGHNATPDYSPDGKYIAYISLRGRQQILCIRSLETGQEREFHSKLRRILSPRWSPDGNSILIAGMDYDINRFGNYQVDPKTGIFTPVLLPSKGFRFSSHEWSRDGKSFFHGQSRVTDKYSQIMLREIKSGKEKEIYRTSGFERFRLACSLDGKWLAFINMRNDSALRIIPSAGGEPRELYRCEPKKEQLLNLKWTAEGKYILLVKRKVEQKGLNLWKIPVEGGEPQKIDLGINTLGLSVHPDGQHIALGTMENQPAEVWVMENFLPEAPSQVVKAEPTPTLRQIEVRGRGTRHSRPSFDGKYFSDVDRDSGNLIIRELAKNKEWKIPVTSDPNSFVYESRMSPDSKRVAFLQFDPVEEDFNLCIINLDGTEQRILMDSRQIAGYFNMDTWSLDGKFIFGRLEREPIELVRVSADDGSMQVIKKFDQNRVSKVDVSPDGRYLAYSYREEKTSKTDIFIYDLEQNQETPLVTHTAGDILLGWTPDGENIFFTSDRNGTWDGWLVAVADGKAVGLPEMIRAGIGNIKPIGFTKEGLFYYEFQHQAWNVYTAALDQSTGQVISEPMPIRHVGKDVRPDFSPDGQYLAYLSEPDRNKPQVVRIRTLATGQERELKIDLPRFEWLRWCPDSRHLLITNFGWNSPSRVYKVDIETGTYTLVVSSEQRAIRQAELSADGKTLVYRIRGSGNATRLIVRNIETGDEKEILDIGDVMSANSLAFWSLSPDGKEVAYSIREGEAGKPFVLKIMSMETGESRTLMAEMVLFLLWSPDGRDVLFTRNLNELWCISAEEGEPQKLFEWKEMIMAPRIHPDGQRIAFHSGGYVSEMWVMENFLSEEMVAVRK
jgi:Tol biopolymer transport system component/beta-lactamase regulating signal transducer with metallopeptidase domain